MRMLKAMAVSAWFMALRLDWRECLSNYSSVARNILKLCFRYGIAKPGLTEQRNAECRACTMFNPALGTCGVPGDTWVDPETKRTASFGCWCYLELSNQIASKDCWARWHGLDCGWPDEIRPVK